MAKDMDSGRLVRLLATCAFAIAFACALAGCSSGKTGSSSAAPQSTSASASSATTQTDDGTPLFEFLAENDSSFAGFPTSITPSEVAVITYSRDEYDDKRIEDEQSIAKMLDALGQIVVTDPYTDTAMVTDSGERVVITCKDGSEHVIHFDFGKLVVGKNYHELDNVRSFSNVKSGLDD